MNEGIARLFGVANITCFDDAAVATPIPGLINSLGIAGNANSNEDSSENHNVSAGNNQQFSGDGNSNTVTATIAGQSVDQSIHG
ncbi:hypothetical protein BGZ74_005171 [Mortierella antarctica]|nr:hypothetical protein BGZ74_005171 [Mortierella antarctica]